MKYSAMVLIALVFMFLQACSSEVPEPVPEKKPVKKTLSKDNVFKGYEEKLQRAKDMEKEVLKAAEKQRKAIDG